MNQVELYPIGQFLNENQAFIQNPACQDTLSQTLEFYKRVGFHPPWIGYYAGINGELVGAAAFKGKPVEGKVEIAYGTFPAFQQQGVATGICRELVALSLKTDPSVRITARTLAEENYSTRVLRKNGFVHLGTVMDEEDGEVWEWEYRP